MDLETATKSLSRRATPKIAGSVWWFVLLIACIAIALLLAGLITFYILRRKRRRARARHERIGSNLTAIHPTPSTARRGGLFSRLNQNEEERGLNNEAFDSTSPRQSQEMSHNNNQYQQQQYDQHQYPDEGYVGYQQNSPYDGYRFYEEEEQVQPVTYPQPSSHPHTSNQYSHNRNDSTFSNGPAIQHASESHGHGHNRSESSSTPRQMGPRAPRLQSANV